MAMELSHELDAARAAHWEDPPGARAVAVRCRQAAREDPPFQARALALQGLIALNHGNLKGALELAGEAEPLVGEDPTARCELAALKAQLAFFSGSYTEAVQQAHTTLALADATGDLTLRIFARRTACLVFGNVGVPDLGERFEEALELTLADRDRWQEALSRNDLACFHHECGRLDEAEAELARGLAIAAPLEPNRFLVGVLHSTRADIRLLAGRADEALADAEHALAALVAHGEPNPYVFGVTVRAHVQALAALGRLDDARDSGEDWLARLGDRVPHTQSLVLAAMADALHAAGRTDAAYDALRRSTELEREGLRQLHELRIDLERATLESTALAEQNARLEALVDELNRARGTLEQRTTELETLQDQFREQADRDWLTGLHNRRYLARQLDGAEPAFSFAVVDLDHFKHINDAHGHDAGDQVLVRVAALLLDVVRHSDVVARTGGEEFVLLMPRTDIAAARICCERALTAIRDSDWNDVAEGLRVTASVGIAAAGEAESLDRVAVLADSRLYAAKRSGRDRIVSG